MQDNNPIHHVLSPYCSPLKSPKQPTSSIKRGRVMIIQDPRIKAKCPQCGNWNVKPKLPYPLPPSSHARAGFLESRRLRCTRRGARSVGMSFRCLRSSSQILLKAFQSGLQPLPDLTLHFNVRKVKKWFSELDPAWKRGAINCQDRNVFQKCPNQSH